jgi:hypothetical protein
MTKIRSIYVASVVSLLLGAAHLRADIPALDFTSVTNNFTNGAWSLGWSFTTNVSISVSALGYYNAGLTSPAAAGLSPGCNCGEVGIFNSAGDLLTSAQVTSSDPVIGFFNYQAITPLQLSAGHTYYILAETGSSDYTWNVNGLTVDPNITFDDDAYISSSTLAFGTSSEGTGAVGFFGPNFLDSPGAGGYGDIQTDAPYNLSLGPASTPEPSSLLLFGTVSLATVGALRLRCRRSNPPPNKTASRYAPLPRPPFTVTTFSGSCFTSTTMPKKGAIISSQVWSP